MSQLKSKKIVKDVSIPSKRTKGFKKVTIKNKRASIHKGKANSNAVLSKKLPGRRRVTKKQTNSAESSSVTTNTSLFEAVKLPNNMSIRAIEKTGLIKSNFDEYVRKSMYRISYVTGMCFLLVGSFLASSQFFTVDNPRLMLGEIVSSENVSTTTTESRNEQISIPDPVFQFISKIPEVLLEDYRISFSVTNVKFVKANLLKSGGLVYPLSEVEKLPDNKYRVVVPVNNSTLPDGYYKLSVFVMPENSSTAKVFDSRLFRIGPPPTEVVSTTTKTDPVTDNSVDTTHELSGVEEESVEPKEIINENQVEPAISRFFLIPPSSNVISDTKMFAFSAPSNATSIQLHSIRVGTLEKTFLATPTKLSTNNVFIVNTRNLGDGEYQFLATAKLDGQTIKSESIRVTVRNVAPKAVTLQETTSNNDTETEREFSLPSNDWFNVVKTGQIQNIEQPNDTIDDAAGRLITENHSSLEDLFKRYAIAQQSGDPMMIEIAREALEEKRKSIVTDSLRDARLREISVDIDEQLTKKVDNFKKRVETFENVRREKSSGETSIDTDKDGISDYDETNIYGTDPNEADTDNDGFTDGIEIMRGYNPNDSSAEAIIVFESPKESIGLVREDVLEVKEVLPVISVDEVSSTTTPAKAEIRGRGLPNSFVTLYIFSTPTVVTIRTDADGQFVYTFDKELEDGQHDVYVAMTDNAGEIIAQSNPFSFIKTAQAFTPIDASESQEVTSAPITETSKSSYGVVVGLGILALGLILLMLGISLRPRGESDEEVDTDAGNDDLDTQSKKTGSRFEHIDAS